MQIRGRVDYQTEALNTVLNVTRDSSKPLGTTQAQLALERDGVYKDGRLEIKLRDGTLHVEYTGPEGFARKLDKYLRDVGSFGGSHLAMSVANGRRGKIHIDW